MATAPTFKGGKLLGVNPTLKHSTAQHPLGAHVNSDDDGKCYRYVKFVDAITYVVGHLCTLASATTYDVTNDRAGGSALARHWPVGFLVGDIPLEDEFGWVQCGGIVDDALMGTASVIAGDILMPHATTNGAVAEATEGTNTITCATAMAVIADAATGYVVVAIPH